MGKELKKSIIYVSIGALVGLSSLAIFLRYYLFKNKVVSTAIREWKGWGSPTIVNGKEVVSGGSEQERGYSSRVGTYWKEGTNQDYDGTDRDMAWSSSFISWVMKKSGAKNRFKYSPSHSTYITDSISNRKKGNLTAPFVGYKINEKAPKVGDLVCYSRQDGVDYDTTGSYKSHCDIVVSAKNNEIEVIGGNVNQSVAKKVLKTDDNGFIKDTNYKWFALIRSNI